MYNWHHAQHHGRCRECHVQQLRLDLAAVPTYAATSCGLMKHCCRAGLRHARRKRDDEEQSERQRDRIAACAASAAAAAARHHAATCTLANAADHQQALLTRCGLAGLYEAQERVELPCTF